MKPFDPAAGRVDLGLGVSARRPHEVNALFELWRETLQQGIDAAVAAMRLRATGTRPKVILSDERWFRSDESFTGSFVWCCELLSVPPSRVRDHTLAGLADVIADVERRAEARRAARIRAGKSPTKTIYVKTGKPRGRKPGFKVVRPGSGRSAART
jgi:hypothetical protein